MIPPPARLTSHDCARLAALHRQCLPDSLVSELGPGYAAAFYRYLDRSALERVFVLRDDAGEIFSGCVLSLRPKTLKRRLLLGTPLVLFAGPWCLRRFLRSPAPAALPAKRQTLDDPVPPTMPELLLIFTSPQSRSQGGGAALLGQCEQFLALQRCPQYAVRTVDDPTNRALGFYGRNGFTVVGQSFEHGRTFRVFAKPVPGMRDT